MSKIDVFGIIFDQNVGKFDENLGLLELGRVQEENTGAAACAKRLR